MKKRHLSQLNHIWLQTVFFITAFTTATAQNEQLLPDSIPWIIKDTLTTEDIIQIGYAKGGRLTVAGSVDLVSEKRMNKGLVSNPLNALSGQVAGVSVLPGREAILNSVRVRGTTSLTGGNDPLVIIDDVFADLSTLSMIYPADIESFTILKDASETAQYGARGASGVIKVTTKQGSGGQFRFSYDGNYGIESIYKTLDMLSGERFREVAQQRGMAFLDLGENTDFTKEISRLGWIQNHHIAFGGGRFRQRLLSRITRHIRQDGRIAQFRLPELCCENRHYPTSFREKASFRLGSDGGRQQEPITDRPAKDFLLCCRFQSDIPQP